MGYFSNLAVAIIEDYERLALDFPHDARVRIVARDQNVSEAEVEAVIFPWLDGDYDYLAD